MWSKKQPMDFWENNTGINQLFKYKTVSGTATVASEGWVDVNILNGGYHGTLTEHKKPFLAVMKDREQTRFYMERTFSLGDTLMLVPVYRRLQELGYSPYIRTLPQYHETLRLLGVEVEHMNNVKRSPGIMFDFVVERDHHDPKMQKMHRVEIYSQAVGLSLNYTPSWSMDAIGFPENPVKFDNYIVFQGSGATEKRGLPKAVIQDILYFLNLEEVNVVYIGGAMDLDADKRFTELRYMNQSIPELFSIIHNAKMVVSMDSSPIWVSHFTRTPLTAVLGPSRPDERLSLHPLLKTDVTALRLNEWIKCKPCFERAVACENKVTCFTRVKAEKIYEELRPSIMKYWRDK